MYPRTTVLTTVWEEKIDRDTIYFAENPNGCQYEVAFEVFEALQMADGLQKPQLSDDIINQLVDADLMTKKHFNLNGIIGTFAINIIGHRLDGLKGFARVFSTLLPFLAPLIFVVGVISYWFGLPIYSKAFSQPMHIFFLILSLTLHEAGHALTGLANDYDLKDWGILCLLVIPIGAYVRTYPRDDDLVKNKIHFFLAGVEMNLLTAGIMLLAVRLFPLIAINLYNAAILNVLLLIANLVPIIGLDGERAFSALIGVESIGYTGIRIFTDRQYRQHLLHSGTPGLVCIAIVTLVDLVAVSYLVYFVWSWVMVLL